MKNKNIFTKIFIIFQKPTKLEKSTFFVGFNIT